MGAGGKGFSSWKKTARYMASYDSAQPALKKAADKAVALLYADRRYPSLKAHQIKPDKYYWEAYANAGDRIIYIPDGDCLILVDLVPHDDIGRYGKRLKQG